MSAFQSCVSHSTAPTTKKTTPVDSTVITLPTLAQLQTFTSVQIQFIGKQNYDGDPTVMEHYFSGSAPNWNFRQAILWNTNFFSNGQSLEGSVDSSNSFIDSIKFASQTNTENYDNNGRFLQRTGKGYRLQGSLIPISQSSADSVTFLLKGASLKDRLSDVYFNFAFTDRSGSGQYGYVSTDWQDSIIIPQIIIKFYK